MTRATVEEAHGGGAADAGQGGPEEAGAGEGVGGQEAAEPAEEGDGGLRDAAGQQSAGEVDDAVAQGRGQCEKGTHSFTSAPSTG